MSLKSILPALLIVVTLFASTLSYARSSRVREVPMENSEDGNPGYTYGGGESPASVVVRSTTGREATLLAQAAGNGAGRLVPDTGAMCYKGVKQIVADAFGKDLSCTRRILSEGSAKNAGRDLKRVGIVNKFPGDECFRAGTVRVYGGKSVSPYRPSAGDIHGHIEVITDDGNFCSDFCKNLPIDKWMPDGRHRRPLIGCWVMPSGGLEDSSLKNCPNRGKPADGRVGGSGVN